MMKSGSMEGLIGANANVNIAKVPLRVYKEAERKGDQATMERSMGYFTEFSQKAVRDTERAAEETLKEQREERVEREREAEEALERKIEENRAADKAQAETKPEAQAPAEAVAGIAEAAPAELEKVTPPVPTETIPENSLRLYTDSGAVQPIAEPTVRLDVRG
ncbi:MAG: hypothetical protein K2N29_03560 [Ruminiclostridium sp.]|nr:hypothetical protein [Ruminiclostridium sp.]